MTRDAFRGEDPCGGEFCIGSDHGSAGKLEGLKLEEMAQRGFADDAGGDAGGEPLNCLGGCATDVGRCSWDVAKGSPCLGGKVGDSGRPGDGCFCCWAKGGAVGPDV